MRQRTFFDDDEATIVINPTVAPTPAELAILRELETEAELASLTPEQRQALYRRLAGEQRRMASESRKSVHRP